MLPDVSVIVTCFNYGRFLERCLRSIFNQEHNNRFSYEVVLVDDDSHDHTGAVVRKFENKFPNLLYIRNTSNRGLAASCNIAIGESSGRYVVRVDADDWVNRHFLFLLKYSLDKNRKHQAFCCDYFEVDAFERNLRQVEWLENEIACAVMYRKEFIEEVGLYNEKFEYREGHELSKRFRNKYSIGSLPVPLYYVRKHNGNRSNDVENIKKYDAQLGELDD